MNLGQRIAALRRDIGQAERDKRLEPTWRRELTEALHELAHVQHHLPVPRDGVDYSWARPQPAALRRAGATFAVRYVGSPAGEGKFLGRQEAENLSHAGIELAAVWEGGAMRMQQGRAAGASDARQAHAAAIGCGMPAGRPVYFACDFDAAGAGELRPVSEYVAGAVEAIGWQRVGVYGGIGLIEHLHQLNRCKYLWQTLAWSAGRWSSHAQLRQIAVGKHVAGGEVDLDRAMAGDFGQWTV